MTAPEKQEPRRVNQADVRNVLKHAAVEAATRSDIHPTALMRVRWVVTRTPGSSLKARLVVRAFEGPQLGACPQRRQLYVFDVLRDGRDSCRNKTKAR